VDTHVRGLVYEAPGHLPTRFFAGGEEAVSRLSVTYHMPVEVVRHPPDESATWVEAMASGVDRVLAA
jgi:hypothetical protein